MGEIYDVSDRKKCKSCIYWYSYAELCGYSTAENEVRTVKMGKKRLPQGKCDKYKKGKGSERRKAFEHGIL